MGETHELFDRLRQTRLVALLSPTSAEACVAAYEIAESEGTSIAVGRSEGRLQPVAARLAWGAPSYSPPDR